MDASAVGRTYSTEELFGPAQAAMPKTTLTTEELWPTPAKTTEELFPQSKGQSFLKTLGQETVDKLGGLGETIVSAGSAIAGFPLGVASGAGKLAYDAWKSGGQNVDIQSAKEFGEKVTEKAIYQPKTSFGQTTTQALAAPVTAVQSGVKAGARAITSDPQAQAAIEMAGDAALAFFIPKVLKATREAGKAISTSLYEDSIKQVVKKGIDTGHAPEVMSVIENTIRENVTPGTIFEEVKRNVGTRKAEVKEAVPSLTEPVAEAPTIDVRISRDATTGETVIRIPREAPKPVAEQPPQVTVPENPPATVGGRDIKGMGGERNEVKVAPLIPADELAKIGRPNDPRALEMAVEAAVLYQPNGT